MAAASREVRRRACCSWVSAHSAQRAESHSSRAAASASSVLVTRLADGVAGANEAALGTASQSRRMVRPTSWLSSTLLSVPAMALDSGAAKN